MTSIPCHTFWNMSWYTNENIHSKTTSRSKVVSLKIELIISITRECSSLYLFSALINHHFSCWLLLYKINSKWLATSIGHSNITHLSSFRAKIVKNSWLLHFLCSSNFFPVQGSLAPFYTGAPRTDTSVRRSEAFYLLKTPIHHPLKRWSKKLWTVRVS